jgi:hypothetical protein
LQEHVRDLFNDAFNVTKDEDYILLQSPSKEDLATFSETRSSGPDPSDLRWDFNHPPSSDWNQAVIHILMRKLVIMREENEWTTAPRSDIYWEDAITQKLNRIRTLVCKAKPRIQGDNLVETELQVAERLMRTKEESLKKARRDARRVTVRR